MVVCGMELGDHFLLRYGKSSALRLLVMAGIAAVAFDVSAVRQRDEASRARQIPTFERLLVGGDGLEIVRPRTEHAVTAGNLADEGRRREGLR